MTVPILRTVAIRIAIAATATIQIMTVAIRTTIRVISVAAAGGVVTAKNWDGTVSTSL
jgi:hypothetical protein